MTGSRNHQKVEVLVRLHKRIDDLHRRRRIDVRIQLADDQEELARQTSKTWSMEQD